MEEAFLSLSPTTDIDLSARDERKLSGMMKKSVKKSNKADSSGAGNGDYMMFMVLEEAESVPRARNRMGIRLGGSETITVLRDGAQTGFWIPVAEDLVDEKLASSAKRVGFWSSDETSTAVVYCPNRQGEVFTWNDLKNHVVMYDVQGGGEGVQFRIHLDAEGGKKIDAITRKNLGKRLAVIFNGQVVAAPTIQSVIGQQLLITGFRPGPSLRALQAAMESVFANLAEDQSKSGLR